MLSVACLLCNLSLLHQMRNFWPYPKVGFLVIFRIYVAKSNETNIVSSLDDPADLQTPLQRTFHI